MRELLRAGAEVNGSVGSYTPLHYAAARGYVDVVRELLAAGAQVNAIHIPTGQTALMYAAMTDMDPEVYYLLCKSGADVNMVDNKGMTAIDHAKTRNKKDILRDACSVRQPVTSVAETGVNLAGETPISTALSLPGSSENYTNLVNTQLLEKGGRRHRTRAKKRKHRSKRKTRR